jgi:hypothetical protein
MPRSRSPNDFVSPRAVLINRVRASTSAARARIIARSACAASPRCRIGNSIFGSTRANRASVSASSRSCLLLDSAISRVRRGLATITSWPIAFRCRLTHGECVPTSNARRLGRSVPKTRLRSFLVVATALAATTSPLLVQNAVTRTSVPQVDSYG